MTPQIDNSLPPPNPQKDRLPFNKKLRLIAEKGLWQEIDRVARSYGWDSREVCAFFAEHLDKAQCPVCNETYYVHSRRVKYCSDTCRRKAANNIQAIRRDEQESATEQRLEHRDTLPEGGMEAELWCDLSEGRDRRIYLIRLVPGHGSIYTVIRQWWRDGARRRQETKTEFETAAAAVEEFYRIEDQCTKRGYQLARTHLPQQS